MEPTLPDINDIIDKLVAALDNETGVRLTKDEVDELLWTLGENDMAIQLQRYLIGMLEAERATIN